jgi:Spherulation-specific family 4
VRLLQLMREHPRVPFIVILNKASGVGTAYDPKLDAAARQINAIGGRCIGYVDTAYGARASGLVEAETAQWFAWYPKVIKGAFLDQVGGDLNHAHYKGIRETLEGTGSSVLVFNPGGPLLSSWYDDNVFGDQIVVLWENSSFPMPNGYDEVGGIDTHLFFESAQRALIVKLQSSLDTAAIKTAQKYYRWIGWADDEFFNHVPTDFDQFLELLDPSTAKVEVGQALNVSINGQTTFSFSGLITVPAATWLEVNNDACRYGTDYLLDLGTSTLTWLGLFKLEIGDQITLYS